MTTAMTVPDAQREMRSVYLGGSMGQAVSGLVWLASSAAAVLSGPRAAILVLVIGGMFIFPMTQAALRLVGRRASVDPDNPLRSLAVQVAFVVPLLLPVAGGAALYELAWFYPAVLMIVGAHYLPFVFLYGSRGYGVLAAAMLASGLAIGLWLPGSFAIGGWVGASLLLAFAAWTGIAHARGGARDGRAG